MSDNASQGQSGQDQTRKTSTRREFLVHGSVAAAGMVAGASAASAKAASPMVAGIPTPQDPGSLVKLGVIGVGGMGSAHCRSIMNLAKEGKTNCHITALADVCKPRLDSNIKSCSETQGLEVKGYRNYRDMLEKEELDAVLIASPEHWHAQMGIDSLRKGCDVYVEKPMTLRLKDAFRLWRAEMESDRFVQVGTQYIMKEKYREARRLIKEGAIGHPTMSQTSYCRNTPGGEWNYYGIDERVKPGEMLDWEGWCGPLGPRSFDTFVYHRWRRYRDFSTGIIGDLLVHVMTPMIMAVDAGWPVRVTATGGHYVDKAMENHDQVNLTIQFEKEHTLIVAGSTCNATGLETMIRGHKGNLYLGGNNCELRPEQPYQDDVDPVTSKYPSRPDHDLLRLNFLECVRTREAPISPVELGLKVMVCVDLASRALWEGGTWGYSPASMSAFRV